MRVAAQQIGQICPMVVDGIEATSMGSYVFPTCFVTFPLLSSMWVYVDLLFFDEHPFILSVRDTVASAISKTVTDTLSGQN